MRRYRQPENLTGRRFGRLTVVGPAPRVGCGKARWECRCDCGQTSPHFANALKSGKATTCGDPLCKWGSYDLTGQRFGLLVVLARGESTRHGASRWLCRCDCGRETLVYRGSLLSGRTRTYGSRDPEHMREQPTAPVGE